MKQNFIKFSKDSVHLVSAFASAKESSFTATDIADGSLVIGTFGDGKYLAMGWLRGMARDPDTGKVLCEIVNAVEGDCITCIASARRVVTESVPALAANYADGITPLIGRAFACNGETAKLYTYDCTEAVPTEFIYRLEPMFKETK